MTLRVLLSLPLTLVMCCLALAEGKADLSSPTATILTYCNAVSRADLSTVRESFHPNLKLEQEGFKKPIWSECRIIKKNKTRLAGKDIGEGFVAQRGDVEVTIEVRMIDPQKENPKTRFWYLLRNVEGNWKIISTSHLPDKNYPRMD